MNRPKFRFYNRLPERYRKTILSDFTIPGGELYPAVVDNKVVQTIIARSKHGKILGWCAIYKSIRDVEPICGKDYSLGIFVDSKYRHRGIGGKLRRKSILWCLRRHKIVWFFQNGYIETLATKEGLQYIGA